MKWYFLVVCDTFDSWESTWACLGVCFVGQVVVPVVRIYAITGVCELTKMHLKWPLKYTRRENQIKLIHIKTIARINLTRCKTLHIHLWGQLAWSPRPSNTDRRRSNYRRHDGGRGQKRNHPHLPTLWQPFTIHWKGLGTRLEANMTNFA